jgi:hypothetical protein
MPHYRMTLGAVSGRSELYIVDGEPTRRVSVGNSGKTRSHK